MGLNSIGLCSDRLVPDSALNRQDETHQRGGPFLRQLEQLTIGLDERFETVKKFQTVLLSFEPERTDKAKVKIGSEFS